MFVVGPLLPIKARAKKIFNYQWRNNVSKGPGADIFLGALSPTFRNHSNFMHSLQNAEKNYSKKA